MSIARTPHSRATTGARSHSQTIQVPFTAEFTKNLTTSSPRFGTLSHPSFFSRHNPHPNRVRHIQGEWVDLKIKLSPAIRFCQLQQIDVFFSFFFSTDVRGCFENVFIYCNWLQYIRSTINTWSKHILLVPSQSKRKHDTWANFCPFFRSGLPCV